MIPILDSRIKKIDKIFLKSLEFSIKQHTRKKRVRRLSLYMTLRPEPVFLNVYRAQESIPRNEVSQPM